MTGFCSFPRRGDSGEVKGGTEVWPTSLTSWLWEPNVRIQQIAAVLGAARIWICIGSSEQGLVQRQEELVVETPPRGFCAGDERAKRLWQSPQQQNFTQIWVYWMVTSTTTEEPNFTKLQRTNWGQYVLHDILVGDLLLLSKQYSVLSTFICLPALWNSPLLATGHSCSLFILFFFVFF